ncbi:hypothetical protein V6N12_070971 [Hibiscus sabdariffa]|uniref:Uncharacterized protein n=1 Tax=Hibiscus sabdariffa TaxID=183260 RepID=A0ABR2FIZ5_9ROSI
MWAILELDRFDGPCEVQLLKQSVKEGSPSCPHLIRNLRILQIDEKKDQTPVTVADFGVQALDLAYSNKLSLIELSKLFPSIPLVPEEDSGFLRSNNLVDHVVGAVSDKTSFDEESFSHVDVLEAIDRNTSPVGMVGMYFLDMVKSPNLMQILDPIDGL